MLMEISWSRRWGWVKLKRWKQCWIFVVVNFWCQGEGWWGLWQSLCWWRSDAHSQCLAQAAGPGDKNYTIKSILRPPCGPKNANSFFLLLQSGGGQEMTEEEVANLDLELELELDNVNADNIDWAISPPPLVWLGNLRLASNWNKLALSHYLTCACSFP